MDDRKKIPTKVKRLERTVEDLLAEFDEVYERLRLLEAEADDDVYMDPMDWDGE